MVEEYPDIYPGYEEKLEEEQEDAEEEQYERQQELYEETTPAFKPKDDLYSLFWKVIRTVDSSKVSNLDKGELGMLNISVRDCQKIALLALTLGHPGFANFFQAQAEIILSTSASKKGWLPELFVSQRRVKSKSKDSTQSLEPQPRKKGLFSKRR